MLELAFDDDRADPVKLATGKSVPREGRLVASLLRAGLRTRTDLLL